MEKVLTILFAACGLFIIASLGWLLWHDHATTRGTIILEAYVLCASAVMYAIRLSRFGRRFNRRS